LAALKRLPPHRRHVRSVIASCSDVTVATGP
jgi:hypothetical protein